MKLSIVLEDDSRNQKCFTSTDVVSGTVYVSLKSGESISSINVRLQGTIETAVVATSTNSKDKILHATDNHKTHKLTVTGQLFQVSQCIFPDAGIPSSSKGYVLPSGTSRFPFSVRFPILTQCIKSLGWIRHISSSLPPSISIERRTGDGMARVSYLLNVKAQRPGRFKADVASKLSIVFLPLDPMLPPPMLVPIYGLTKRIIHARPLEFDRTDLRGSTTVTLQASLPSPAILCRSHHVPLGLRITRIDKIDGTGAALPAIISTLSIALITKTTVTVGPNSPTWSSTMELLSLSGLQIPVDHDGSDADEHGTVSEDLWKDVVVPDIPPSFTTCTLKQQHFLVVTTGLKYGVRDDLSILRVSINVEVHCGIRPRDVSMDTDVPQLTAFIPWRVGSGRHLGITGMNINSRVPGTPPPPY